MTKKAYARAGVGCRSGQQPETPNSVAWWRLISARGRRRFFRNADRLGADPISDPVSSRRSAHQDGACADGRLVVQGPDHSRLSRHAIVASVVIRSEPIRIASLDIGTSSHARRPSYATLPLCDRGRHRSSREDSRHVRSRVYARTIFCTIARAAVKRGMRRSRVMKRTSRNAGEEFARPHNAVVR